MLRYIDASPDDISLIDKWLEMGNNDFAYKEADLWKKRDLRHLSELKDKNKNR